jgi:hypothetical protein
MKNVLALFVSVISVCGFGQICSTTAPSPLKLQIVADQRVQRIPQEFSVVLSNAGNREVRVPMPAVQCANSLDGSVGVRLDFTPKDPKDAPRGGHVCVADSVGQSSVLERVAYWGALQPGESMQFRVTADMMFLESTAPGKYEFTAQYVPPYLSKQDRATLSREGILVAETPLASGTITFSKD